MSCAEQFETADDVSVVSSRACFPACMFCRYVPHPHLSQQYRTVLQVSYRNNTMCTFPVGLSAETTWQNRGPALQVSFRYFIVIVFHCLLLSRNGRVTGRCDITPMRSPHSLSSKMNHIVVITSNPTQRGVDLTNFLSGGSKPSNLSCSYS